MSESLPTICDLLTMSILKWVKKKLYPGLVKLGGRQKMPTFFLAMITFFYIWLNKSFGCNLNFDKINALFVENFVFLKSCWCKVLDILKVCKGKKNRYLLFSIIPVTTKFIIKFFVLIILWIKIQLRAADLPNQGFKKNARH